MNTEYCEGVLAYLLICNSCSFKTRFDYTEFVKLFTIFKSIYNI